MKLLTIVPSYGRPQNAWRLVKAFSRTRALDDTDLVFVLDSDDPTRDEYPQPHLVTSTKGMVPALNAAANLFAAEDQEWDIIGFMGDDHLPVTEGWDRDYINAITEMGGTGMVYGNDRLQGARIPTQIAMSSNIIRTLGWMAPPTFKHLFVDDAWLAIGRAINRVQYLPNTVIEHLHPLGGQVENDANYDRVNAPEIATHDQEEYRRWVAQDLGNIKASLQVLL